MKLVIKETISALFRGNKTKKPVLFIVNTDEGYGLYVKKLVRLANKLNLVAKSKAALKNIQFGDVIVFGDSHLFEDREFDYRVLRNVELLESTLYENGENLAFDLF
jgi:hypothetical protein